MSRALNKLSDTQLRKINGTPAQKTAFLNDGWKPERQAFNQWPFNLVFHLQGRNGKGGTTGTH
ncbi:integrase of prophage [Escherichia coli]|nr:integrase of prophage [Escherichia coli]